MLFLQKWFWVLSHEYTNGFQIQILFEALLIFNQGLDCDVLIFVVLLRLTFRTASQENNHELPESVYEPDIL